MFTVELKINGALIGHIHGQNITTESNSGECEYSYEYYDVQKKEINRGQVVHNRPDGIRNLIKIILEDLEEPTNLQRVGRI